MKKPDIEIVDERSPLHDNERPKKRSKLINTQTDEDVAMSLLRDQALEKVAEGCGVIWDWAATAAKQVGKVGYWTLEPPVKNVWRILIATPQTVAGVVTNAVSSGIDFVTFGGFDKGFGSFLKIGKAISCCNDQPRSAAQRTELLARAAVTLAAGVYCSLEMVRVVARAAGWTEGEMPVNPFGIGDDLQDLNPGQYIAVSALLVYGYENGVVYSNWLITQIKAYFSATNEEARAGIFEKINQHYQENKASEQGQEVWHEAQQHGEKWHVVAGAYLYAGWDQAWNAARRMTVGYFSEGAMGQQVTAYKKERYLDWKQSFSKRAEQYVPSCITRATAAVVSFMLPKQPPDMDKFVQHGNKQRDESSGVGATAIRHRVLAFNDRRNGAKDATWQQSLNNKELLDAYKHHQGYYSSYEILPYSDNPNEQPPINLESLQDANHVVKQAEKAAVAALFSPYANEGEQIANATAYFQAHTNWKQEVNNFSDTPVLAV